MMAGREIDPSRNRGRLNRFNSLAGTLKGDVAMPPVERVSLPLEHHVPDSVITRLANHVTLQLDPDGCYLSFYEAIPPLLVGQSRGCQESTGEREVIRAECVARVFLPKTRMADFLNVLKNTLEPALSGQPGHETQPHRGGRATGHESSADHRRLTGGGGDAFLVPAGRSAGRDRAGAHALPDRGLGDRES